ncbi:hypothetical protein [Pseudarthrobacter sp. BIM B-2242]|uniref:hypothetical protein n=1 Tax=Pseudarthrobacter sp. BIM B-2242 TaxID=2772401 RepID=UPI00168BD450|nr:hypothetical protein [Pseudarthrobacter sp. BIM B-2242]QOD05982.1 hypothetical protein IDT60_20655 [Pseudarthrobacter sp. BIM B-2242]
MDFRRYAKAAVLMGAVVLTLTAASCDERRFTREDALAVPHSVVQVGEYRDKDWEYVDSDGVAQKLNRCEDLSPWTVEYRCTSLDGSVELTFDSSKYDRMGDATLHIDGKDVLLDCINGGFWTDGKMFCMPASAVPKPSGPASES